MTLIELDKILLVPPGKVGVLDSPSSTIRARYRHIEDGFPRSISSSRPVDISTSINPCRARFPELDLFIEAGWHIELGKVVSSSVAQKTKLIRFFFFSVSSISFDCRTQSNSIHRLSSIEFDWVRLGSIYYAGCITIGIHLILVKATWTRINQWLYLSSWVKV